MNTSHTRASACAYLARLAGPLALALFGLSSTAWARGGSFDLSVSSIDVVQTLPDVTLIGEKPAMVRAFIGVSGTLPAGTEVDGLLRVFVNGFEAPYSPVYSDNGPFTPPLVPNGGVLNDTLNFVFLPGVGSNVTVTVEINPDGGKQVCETNFANNSLSTGPLTFQQTRKPEIVYVPIDYRVGGVGGVNVPPANRIEPGNGDNFIQGVYATGDWEYRISDSPSKLWTGSLANSGSALNASLLQDLLMMNPQPDYIYGWVKGTLSYNGQAINIPGRAAMGVSQQIRHQRTFAHELGHLLGLNHINNTLGRVGIDVEHHLNKGSGTSLPQLKPSNLFDIMVAGQLTNSAWIYPPNYEFFVNHPTFAPTEAPAVPDDEPKLLVSGLWDRAQGTAVITDTVAIRASLASPLVPLEEANLLIRVQTEGGLVEDLGLLVNTSTDSCTPVTEKTDHEESHPNDATSDSWEGELALAGFAVVLPGRIAPHSIERLTLVDVARALEMTQMKRSASAPSLQVLSPRSGAGLTDQVLVEWNASDADGDDLKHYLRYSPDGERLIPLASGLFRPRHELDMASLPQPEAGKAYFEVLTSDGLRTTRALSTNLESASQSLAAGGNLPITHILSPDDGKSFEKGATVMLHSSGWDLEDRAIEGADIEWSSDLDGVLDTGRVTFITDLSVGTHQLTVTATDSGGQTSSDTHVITITGRFLPEATCGEDVGFSGPGTALLEVCGGDLSTGTTADVMLTGAAPNTTIYVVYGTSSTPTPVLGGTLVPVPVDGILADLTDSNGEWFLEDGILGGGGPVPFYLQAVYMDPALPTSFGFSNAVRADILP